MDDPLETHVFSPFIRYRKKKKEKNTKKRRKSTCLESNRIAVKFVAVL